MLRSEARVATASPRRYLGQLCKHFGHKVPASCDGRLGRIDFPFGPCELDASAEDALVLRVAAADDEALARLEHVVGSHLERFAFREALEIAWSRTPPAP
ncbi:DUF2218 domain-containing protein [Roseomonas eburnea]|uniref:DUF2218 domain-containing protein n=1 Tax=Neoroseomonas eburnea TaxID=1346889 RepID=A0A9X9XFH1_9PROT|nr:DUF2218 domain-containing protein [Neoroseomonas eburnea]MBR0682457.1 DUF2218 domain-containing protein [Neoroseomonas eburnea]